MHYANRLRRQLLAKGFTSLPRCPLCRVPQRPLEFSRHTRQCERDLLSLSLEACDRQMAVLYATEPTSEAERVDLDESV